MDFPDLVLNLRNAIGHERHGLLLFISHAKPGFNQPALTDLMYFAG